VTAFGKTRGVTETFYRYSAEGWQLANSNDCHECEYVKSAASPSDNQFNCDRMEPDMAIAARAVACVKLIKG